METDEEEGSVPTADEEEGDCVEEVESGAAVGVDDGAEAVAEGASSPSG